MTTESALCWLIILVTSNEGTKAANALHHSAMGKGYDSQALLYLLSGLGFSLIRLLSLIPVVIWLLTHLS